MEAVYLRSSMRMNAQSKKKKNSWRLCLIISDIRNMISTNHVSRLKELQICNQNCVYKLSFCLPQDKTEPTS